MLQVAAASEPARDRDGGGQIQHNIRGTEQGSRRIAQLVIRKRLLQQPDSGNLISRDIGPDVMRDADSDEAFRHQHRVQLRQAVVRDKDEDKVYVG